jgi:PhnB protein
MFLQSASRRMQHRLLAREDPVMPVSPIPNGYPRVSPYLVVEDAKRAIDWYVEALGATEIARLAGANDTVMHAEVRIGDSVVMLGEQMLEMGAVAPKRLGGTPVSLVCYVEDVDAAFAKAVTAGATAERPVADQPFGDRMGTLVDPFGHRWHLSTHIEDVSMEEVARRMAPAS